MLQYGSSLDAAFAALADPTRRGIVTRLCESELSVGQLAEPLDMTLSAVGQHLRILEKSGLIASEKRGRARFCRVDLDTLSAVESWLQGRRRQTERRLDRLQRRLSPERKHDAP